MIRVSQKGLFNYINSRNDKLKYYLLTINYIYKKLSKNAAYNYEISFSKDIFYIKYLSFLENNDPFNVFNFINAIKDERIKIELLHKTCLSSKQIYNIIEDMSDNYKVVFFDRLNLCEQIRLVKSLSDDNLKIKYLDSFPMDRKWIIVCSLSDELKLDYLYKNEYKEYKNNIIKTISDKEVLLKVIKMIDKEGQIDFILKTQDLSLKYEVYKLIPNLTSDERFNIINNIIKYENDINKIKSLTSIITDYNLSKLMINSKKDKEVLLKDIDITYINPNIDNKITIGLEIETSHDSYYVYEKLDSIIKGWKIVKDISLKDGIEIISPVLNYDLESLKEIFYVCKVLKENNFFENETCAGHIHIGLDYFESMDELIVFYNIFCNCEYIFYLISNKENNKVRNEIIKYSKPISSLISQNNDIYNLRKSSGLFSFVNKLKRIQKTSRDYSINIKNAFNEDKNTIEYRVPNGEIEYDELVYNIILLTSLVTVSKRISKGFKSKYLDLILDNTISNEMKLECLLNILFEDDEELKEIYRNRFYSNNIDNEINNEIKKYIKSVVI